MSISNFAYVNGCPSTNCTNVVMAINEVEKNISNVRIKCGGILWLTH
jgi:hypothetical protein